METDKIKSKIFEIKGLSKSYPGVLALDDVNISLYANEIVALVGENGAGKSTMVKVISGAIKQDKGKMFIEDDIYEINNPIDAINKGISVIYQEFNLVPNLSVSENIFLGRELQNYLGFVDYKKMRKKAEELIKIMDVAIDVKSLVGYLSVAQQQIVEIAKALSVDSKIIIMDEPSATLTLEEISNLFRIVKDLKKAGKTIVYITHRLEEIFEIADRVIVLRDGKLIGINKASDVTKRSLIKDMVGKEIEQEFPREYFNKGDTVLRVEDFALAGLFEGINFELKKGEIFGISGLVGAGKTEFAKAIFGAFGSKVKGKVLLNGKAFRIKSPYTSIRQGLGLVVEDRKNEGLVMTMSIKNNITLTNLKKISNGFFISNKKEDAEVNKFVKSVRIKVYDINRGVKELSGGNQQKVCLSKWLYSDVKIMIFDEPTRGIDVGAKHEIYLLLNELVKNGIGVIIISSELEEIIGLCDRVMVLYERKMNKIIDRNDKNSFIKEEIMRLATGGH